MTRTFLPFWLGLPFILLLFVLVAMVCGKSNNIAGGIIVDLTLADFVKAMERKPDYLALLPALPLAIISSLGSTNATSSLLKVLLGSALVALPLAFTVALHDMLSLEVASEHTEKAKLLILTAGAPIYFLLIAKPLLAGAAAFAVLFHLLRDAKNGQPMPLQSWLGGGDVEARDQMLAGAFIILFPVWANFPGTLF